MNPDSVSYSRILSQAIEIARFPMMLLIVFIHSDICGDTIGGDMPTAAYDVIYYISQTLARIAVPIFFFISGFLYFYNKDVGTPYFYRNQLKKRVKTLLVPYLLWNLIAILFTWFKTQPYMASFFPRMVGVKLGFIDFINAFGPFSFLPEHGFLGNYDPASAPADVPLWFIRDLMAIMLLAPVVYRIMKGRIGMVTCAVLLFLFLSGLWPEACFWFDLTGVCFFCFGAYFSVNGYNPLALVDRHVNTVMPCLMVLYLLTSILRVIYASGPVSPYFLALSIVVGMPCFLLICCKLAARGFKPMPFLLSATFFMYAFHGLIGSIVKKMVLTMLHPTTTVVYVMAFLTVAVLLVVISLALYALLNKISPSLTAMLSGMRTQKAK